MNAVTALLHRPRRTVHTTIHDRLIAAGYDPAQLTEESQTRTIVPAFGAHPDGTKIVGVVYQTDYRYEEEAGVSELRKAIAGTDPRTTTMTKDARRRVARFADVNGFILSTRFLPTRTYAWGDDLESGERITSRWGRPLPEGYVPDYQAHFTSNLALARRDKFAHEVQCGWVTMQELRAVAAKLGLSGLPRTKAALTERILTSPEYAATAPRSDVWPAWFHYGSHLVVRADDGSAAVIVEALGDALDAGHLAIGMHSGPFASGVFLYDGRDETDAIRAARIEACDWHDARMKELEPVAAALRANGHRWYYLGKPRPHTNPDGTEVVRYWLNGERGGVTRDGVRSLRQPWGWYTLEELKQEKFVRDFSSLERERS